MKRRLGWFLLILPLALFSCSLPWPLSTVKSPPSASPSPDQSAHPPLPSFIPTPFAIQEILSSLQFSPPEAPLCPAEDYYRTLPADFYLRKWLFWITNPPTSAYSVHTMGLISVSDGTLLGFNTYEVPEHKAVTATFRYYVTETGKEGEDKPQLVRFLLIVDEQQVATKFNYSGEALLFVDIITYPGEDAALTVEIPPLGPGIHDINLIGVVMVEQEKGEQSLTTWPYRFTLIAGGKKMLLPRSYVRLPRGNRRVLQREVDTISTGLSLSLEKDRIGDWTDPDQFLSVSPGRPIDFYIYTGYEAVRNDTCPDMPQPEEQPFALLRSRIIGKFPFPARRR